MIAVLPDHERQSGQVVLVTLLILAVVLSVGMSIVSRSITDVKTSQQSQESARAFWVAQGELEKAIRSNTTSSSVGSVEISYEVTRSTLGGSQEYLYPEQLRADYPATIWFVGHTADGDLDTDSFVQPSTINIYWGNTTDDKPALELTFVYQELGVYRLGRYVYDPDETVTGSGFDSVTAGDYSVLNNHFVYRAQISDLNLFPSLYFVRVNLIGDSSISRLAVTSDVNLPDQAECYLSTAVVEASGITRKLSECRLFNEYPSIFDTVLYSGAAI